MNTFDFNRSYLRFRVEPAAQPAITVTHSMPTTVNNVRINLECRCEILDRSTGRAHAYALAASCKTERVGADRDCWLLPNADFCAVSSKDEFMMIKSWARNGLVSLKDPTAQGVPVERQSGRSCEAWHQHKLQLHAAHGRALSSIDEVIAAIQGDRPIVSRTEYDDGDYRVTIEHPVKTINYSEVENVFQTDTGPILLPDLTRERLERGALLVDCFDLAYSAFNSAGWAEFILNVPTPVGDGITVDHYSRVRRIEPVRNTLIEVLDEARVPRLHAAGGRAVRADHAVGG